MFQVGHICSDYCFFKTYKNLAKMNGNKQKRTNMNN